MPNQSLMPRLDPRTARSIIVGFLSSHGPQSIPDVEAEVRRQLPNHSRQNIGQAIAAALPNDEFMFDEDTGLLSLAPCN